MAKICQVCEEKMSFVEGPYETQGLFMHRKCIKIFVNDPEKYGGIPEKLSSYEKRFITPTRNNLGEEELKPFEKEEAERKAFISRAEPIEIVGFDITIIEWVVILFKINVAVLIFVLPIMLIIMIINS